MTRWAPGVSSGATRWGSARLTVIATLPAGTGLVGCWSTRCPKRDASTISPCEIVLVATSAPVAPLTLVRAPAGTPLATTDCSTRSFWATASSAEVPSGTGAAAMYTCCVACPATARASALCA